MATIRNDFLCRLGWNFELNEALGKVSVNKKKVFLISANSNIKKIFIEAFLYQPFVEICGTSESSILPIEELLFSEPDFIIVDSVLYEEEKGIVRNLLEEVPSITIFMLCDLYDPKEVQLTTKALCSGVADYIPKPFELEPTEIQKFKESLIHKFLNWQVKQEKEVFVSNPHSFQASNRYQIVGIHCSTGGLNTLVKILPSLPKDFPLAIFINIEFPKVFAKPFIERLNQISHLYVKEIKDQDVITPSTVYLHFGKFHFEFVEQRNKKFIQQLNNLHEKKGFFHVLAENFSQYLIGVVLSGEGIDLTSEIQFLKQKGGLVILQDENTSLVWENARKIYSQKLYDLLLPTQEISDKLCQLAWV